MRNCVGGRNHITTCTGLADDERARLVEANLPRLDLDAIARDLFASPTWLVRA